MSTITYDRNTNTKTYVIKLDLKYCELPSQWSTILDLLFARRYTNDNVSIEKLINTTAISTKLRKSYHNHEENNIEDSTICIFYRFDHVELPRFTSPLISVWSETEDPREFKRCNKSDYMYLLSSDRIRLLHASEQTYLRNVILNYIDHYSKRERNAVKILE